MIKNFSQFKSTKLVFRLRLLFLFTMLAFAIVGIGLNLRLTINDAKEIEFVKDTPKAETVLKYYVYITGEVKSPGVYEIPEDLRLNELITMAGGFSENADMNYVNQELNLASVLRDQQKIFIPSIDSESSVKSDSTTLINLNTATLEELDTLPGIGLSTAQKIINQRPFTTKEQLLNVSGIGESKYSQVKDLVTVEQ
jgi:competence protein ComEA